MNVRACFLMFVILPLVGCGGTYDSYVTGVVTFDNEPLTRGTVSFRPKSTGPTSYGFIEADGTYTMKTGSEEGLPAGDYAVTIVANEPSIENEEGGPPAPGKPITPKWYRSPDTSGLDCQVASGKNEINFDLTSEPRADWEPEPKKKRRRGR